MQQFHADGMPYVKTNQGCSAEGLPPFLLWSCTSGPLAQPSMGWVAQCAQDDCDGVRDAVSVCPPWRPGTLGG